MNDSGVMEVFMKLVYMYLYITQQKMAENRPSGDEGRARFLFDIVANLGKPHYANLAFQTSASAPQSPKRRHSLTLRRS